MIKSIEDCISLQEDINRGIEWFRTWLMLFNIKKCKVMHVGKNSKKRSNYDYTMKGDDEVEHSLVETVLERDLGVLVSNDLKWHAQVDAASARANRLFGMYKRSFQSRSIALWQTLYKTYIRPHLEYAIQVWSPYLVVSPASSIQG